MSDDAQLQTQAVAEASASLLRDGLCVFGTAMSEDDLARVTVVVRKTGRR